MDENRHGRPLAVSQTAQSSSPTEPAFVARPEGAPVYHGFVVLDDVKVDGFTLGKITEWEAEPCETGDAFGNDVFPDRRDRFLRNGRGKQQKAALREAKSLLIGCAEYKNAETVKLREGKTKK
jgi:hypothetical protein